MRRKVLFDSCLAFHPVPQFLLSEYSGSDWNCVRGASAHQLQRPSHWIPAFAGMTSGLVVAPGTCSKFPPDSIIDQKKCDQEKDAGRGPVTLTL